MRAYVCVCLFVCVCLRVRACTWRRGGACVGVRACVRAYAAGTVAAGSQAFAASDTTAASRIPEDCASVRDGGAHPRCYLAGLHLEEEVFGPIALFCSDLP